MAADAPLTWDEFQDLSNSITAAGAYGCYLSPDDLHSIMDTSPYADHTRPTIDEIIISAKRIVEFQPSDHVFHLPPDNPKPFVPKTIKQLPTYHRAQQHLAKLPRR